MGVTVRQSNFGHDEFAQHAPGSVSTCAAGVTVRPERISLAVARTFSGVMVSKAPRPPGPPAARA